MSFQTIKKAIKKVVKNIIINYTLSTNGLKQVTKNIDYKPISQNIEVQSKYVLGYGNVYDSLPYTLNNSSVKTIIKKKADKYIKIILQDTKLDLDILRELGQNQADAIGLYFVYGKDAYGEEFNAQNIKTTKIFKALKRHDFSSVSRIIREHGFNFPSGTITHANREVFTQIEDLREDAAKLFDKFVDKQKIKINF